LGRSEKAEANRWERKKIERKKKGGDKIEERERERERERELNVHKYLCWAEINLSVSDCQ